MQKPPAGAGGQVSFAAVVYDTGGYKADSLNWNASSCLDFRSFDFSNVKSLIVFLTFGSVEIQVTEFDPSTAEASDHALETLETVNGVPTDQWLAENNGG